MGVAYGGCVVWVSRGRWVVDVATAHLRTEEGAMLTSCLIGVVVAV